MADLRVYFNRMYKRWTVDVLKPSHVDRRTFTTKEKAEQFARVKRSEFLQEQEQQQQQQTGEEGGGASTELKNHSLTV